MTHPHARLRPLAVAALCVVAAAGCVTVDGTLKADGSGTLELTYGVMPHADEATEKYRFTKAGVKLESFKLADYTATAKVSFDDTAKLPKIDVLHLTGLERRRDGDVERVTIRIGNPESHDFNDQGKPGPHIRITLPGPIVEANRSATVDGNTVAWRFGLGEFLKERVVELTASYRVPSPAPEATPKDGEPSAH